MDQHGEDPRTIPDASLDPDALFVALVRAARREDLRLGTRLAVHPPIASVEREIPRPVTRADDAAPREAA